MSVLCNAQAALRGTGVAVATPITTAESTLGGTEEAEFSRFAGLRENELARRTVGMAGVLVVSGVPGT